MDSWKIPGESGHDLVANPNNPNQLLLTEHNSVWVFDKNKGDFTPFERLKDFHDVKGISLTIGEDPQLAYVKAEERWWSHHIYLNNPKRKYKFPDIRLYKVRWIPNDQ